MFHACFISTFLCFVHTLEYFYTFSRTNLLTRCHSVSCLFSAVFGFRKASKEIFSELDGTKPKVIILPKATRSPEEGPSGAAGRPHLVAAWPGGRATRGWCGRPVALLRPPFGLRVVSGKILTLAFVPSNFENISLLAFLKQKKQQETGNWHCGTLLIG